MLHCAANLARVTAMRIRLAAALLALPLLAFDCGGDDPPQNPLGLACTLQIRGAVNEDLWCIVAAYDYSDLDPTSTMWALDLAAYRGMTEVGGGVGFFHDGRPSLATAYGWSGNASTVDSGEAVRYVGEASPVATHEAIAPLMGYGGTGALTVTFSRIPPPGATGAQLMDVHGTLSGTLPAVDGVSGPVTFTATF